MQRTLRALGVITSGLAAAALGACTAEGEQLDDELAPDTIASLDQEAQAAFAESASTSQLDNVLRRQLAAGGVRSVPRPPRQNPALVELGQSLFFDHELAGPRNISCATCHNPLLGSADGQSQSRGQGAIGLGPARRQNGDDVFEFLPRNALSLWNRGVPGWDVMFWDGRLGGNRRDGFFSPAGDATPQDVANSLALFGVIPVTPDQEMRGFPGQRDVFGNVNELARFTNSQFAQIWPVVTARIINNPGYRPLLAAAYPNVPRDRITISNLVNAMGAFQTEAFTALNAPFDRYLAGDTSAMSDAAKRGALLFYGRANCSGCHAGALQTDFEFHNIAAPQLGGGRPGFQPLDIGRAETTGRAQDRFRFRTPSLRNIELEAPYFHNGAYAKLEDAVRHHLLPERSLRTYDDSQIEPELVGTLVTTPAVINELVRTIDPKLAVRGAPLQDREIRDLMAFLSALTDPASLNMLDLVPDRVGSGLPLND